MRSKTSWYNNELTKQNFRHVGWISLIYFIAMAVAIVINILMKIEQDDRYYFYHDSLNLFEHGMFLQILTLFIVPIMTAIFLFRYLHHKDASDFIHSLPMKRKHLFYHQVLFGFGTMLGPVSLIALSLFIMHFVVDVSEFYQLSSLGYWYGITSLILSLVFALTVFVGQLTGTSIIQGIFTFIFLLFPAGFSILVMFNLNYALIGVADYYFMNEKVFEFSPLTDLPNFLYSHVSTTKIIIYIIATLVLLAVSLFLYRKRNVETATQTITFQILKPIFIYSFTFCFTLIGGLYFGAVQYGYDWIVFGYFLFSIFGYLIAQMTLNKTWRIFNKWKEYVIFFIACAVLFLLVMLDFTGFENRVPDPANIDEVYVNDEPYQYHLSGEELDQFSGITDEQTIKAITTLHQRLINDSKRGDFLNYQKQSISLRYQLSNGKQLVREYYVDDLNAYEEQLSKIHQSLEHKMYSNELFRIDQDKIKSLQISSHLVNKEAFISEQEQIDTMINALQEDILTETYYSYRNEKAYFTEIQIEVENDNNLNRYHVYLPVKLSYSHFLTELKEANLYEEAVLLPEDVNKVLIAEREIGLADEFNYEPDNYFNEEAKAVLEITDNEQISQILDSIVYPHQTDGDQYVIGLYINESYPYVYFVKKEHLPDYVHTYFR